MRSARELAFRGGQELANQRVWWMPPRRVPIHDSPLRGLPAAAPVAERLRGTTFARGIEELAQSILDHRFPIPGGLIDTGERIDWRRDYRNNVTSGTKYFRLVKYLDLKTVGDHKVVWDFNRHQHLVVLSQAFLLTGNPQYVAEIEKEIDSWFPANPFMRGVNWTSALEVALRALSWTWIFHLVGSHLSDRTRSSLMTGLYQHGCYIENNLSVYFAPNTHILGEAVAPHALGVLSPKSARASRWAALGERMVNVELARQVRDDGSHFEQSSYYH